MDFGMIVIEKEYFTELHADDGKLCTNGEIFSKLIFLGQADSPNNWWEVPDDMEE